MDPQIKRRIIIREFFHFVAIAIFIVLPFRLFVAQPFIVSGESMSPTFETGQYIIVDQITYQFDDPKRGDVIVFKYPNNNKKFFIKRIIGLPEETLEFRGGNSIYINSANIPEEITLNEPYIEFTKDEFPEEITLSATEYFVMGDNRLRSSDSRSWGPLEEDLIIGRAFLRLWPFNRISFKPGEFDDY